MRIGLITGEYPPMQGGVGAFSRELGAALVHQGHSLFVLTDGRAATSQDPGIQVTATIRNWNRASLFEVCRWMQTNQLDVVNLQYEAAAFQMAPLVHWLPDLLRWHPARRVPVVTTFHDLLVPYLFPRAGALRFRVLLTLACRSDGVIVTNPQDEARLRAAGGIARLAQIPIGSNVRAEAPDDYNRAAWRARLNVPESAILIGYFGFLNASKGVDLLLDAMVSAVAQGVDAYLLLIGGRTGDSDPANAAYAEQIEQQITQLGLVGRIRQTGFVDDVQVSGHLYACEMVALPFRDGVSFRRGSFMAAIAHGCPTITTAPQVDLPELKDGVNVRLLSPDSADTLAAVIRELTFDPALRERLGHHARELAGLFTWDRIAAQTAAFYEGLIGAKHG